MKTQITVRRPDGTIEIIELDKMIPVWERTGIETATRRAGRGEIIDWMIMGIDDATVEAWRAEDRTIKEGRLAEAERQERAFEKMGRRGRRGE